MAAKDLLKKYNVPGPRYTSYPTVPYWCDSPTEAQWIESIRKALKENQAEKVGAALYVHIPFCESLCTYCGCNTRITRNPKVARPYVETVLKEWALYREKLGTEIQIGEIHLGGGTPTFLSSEDLRFLIEGLVSTSRLSNHFEFSLEADPRVTQPGQLDTLRELGFTRLSLGIQDFDHKVQETVHRVQSEEQVRKITDYARSIGYTGINYDLIYGLPFQTLESIQKTVEAVCRLRPDRIAFYSYAHVPWIKPGQRRFTEADLPSGEEKRKLYELGRKMLEDIGYREVGMDHFALETDSLWKAQVEGTLHRNFMGYTPRLVAPLIGLGVSAIGDSWWSFGQNEKLLETYQQVVQSGRLPIYRGHVLTPEDLVLRKQILNLMTRNSTQWQPNGVGADFLANVGARLAEMEKDGLVRMSPNSCEITEAGRPFIRNICMAFDARLIEKSPTTQLFSQTI